MNLKTSNKRLLNEIKCTINILQKKANATIFFGFMTMLFGACGMFEPHKMSNEPMELEIEDANGNEESKNSTRYQDNVTRRSIRSVPQNNPLRRNNRKRRFSNTLSSSNDNDTTTKEVSSPAPARGNYNRNDSPVRRTPAPAPARGNYNRNDSPARGNYNRNDSPARGNYNRNDSPVRGNYNRYDSPARGNYDPFTTNNIPTVDYGFESDYGQENNRLPVIPVRPHPMNFQDVWEYDLAMQNYCKEVELYNQMLGYPERENVQYNQQRCKKRYQEYYLNPDSYDNLYPLY